MVKQALGRGLGALMGGNSPSGKPSTAAAPATLPANPPPLAGSAPNVALPKSAGEPVHKLAISRISSCSFQPRQQFDEPSLEELAQSIKEQGILQPILVRPKGENYEIIAGERRWRAAQKAGLHEVPVVVREASDSQVMEWALIENLQRDNLNPIEEAQGYAQLINKFNLRQEDAAQKVGKSRVTVTNAIRLLQLPPPVQDYVRSNLLSVGHAKALLGLSTPESIRASAEKIIREGMSVRQAEQLVSELNSGPSAKAPSVPAAPGKSSQTADIHVLDLQSKLQERLGTKVQLKYKAGKGAVEIKFFNDNDLDRILEIMGVKTD